jgi:hypothetical protein
MVKLAFYHGSPETGVAVYTTGLGVDTFVKTSVATKAGGISSQDSGFSTIIGVLIVE